MSPTLPYEGVPHAGGTWFLHYLDVVSRHHDVELLVPATPEARRNVAGAPESITLELTPFGPARRDLTVWLDRLRRRVRFASLGAPAQRGLREVDLTGRAATADVVELHWIEAAMLGPRLRRAGVLAPVVVFAHDVTSEAVPARDARLGRRRSPTLDRLRRRVEGRDLAAADLVVVFKEQDEAALLRIGVRAPVHVVAPYLELPAGPRSSPGTGVLFTGAMWRRENQDAVRWFLTHVWPGVVRARPDAELVVAGAGAPASLLAEIEAAPNARATGEVPSLAPYYEAAAVFVAPLFVPGGLKFKVPQAMVHGLPVVASSVAASGIVEVAPPGTFWAVTDDAAAMGAAVVDALARPDDASAVGRAAATWASAHYSFEASIAALLDRYRTLLRR